MQSQYIGLPSHLTRDDFSLLEEGKASVGFSTRVLSEHLLTHGDNSEFIDHTLASSVVDARKMLFIAKTNHLLRSHLIAARHLQLQMKEVRPRMTPSSPIEEYDKLVKLYDRTDAYRFLTFLRNEFAHGSMPTYKVVRFDEGATSIGLSLDSFEGNDGLRGGAKAYVSDSRHNNTFPIIDINTLVVTSSVDLQNMAHKMLLGFVEQERMRANSTQAP